MTMRSFADPKALAGALKRIGNALAKEHARERSCLHPSAPDGCSGPAINAHSIQRRGPLEKILDQQNKVFTFYQVLDTGDHRPITPRSVGWREASTFSGFCSRHDSEVFAPIEREFFQATSMQCALIGYRSLCYEIHQKTAALKILPLQRELFLPILKGQDRMIYQRGSIANEAGLRKGVVYLQNIKKQYEDKIAANAFQDLNFAAFEFEGNLCVASAGSVNPDFDVNGKPIQDLAFDDPIEGIPYGLVLSKDEFAYVFSWPKEYKIMNCFIDEWLKLDEDALVTALVLFMFSYSENTFFSAAWWNLLRITQRMRIRDAAMTQIQYRTPVNYRMSRPVDWRLKKLTLVKS